jgi:hypothetical protein
MYQEHDYKLVSPDPTVIRPRRPTRRAAAVVDDAQGSARPSDSDRRSSDRRSSDRMAREREPRGRRRWVLGIIPMWVVTTFCYVLLLAAFGFVTVKLTGHSDPMHAVLERVMNGSWTSAHDNR